MVWTLKLHVIETSYWKLNFQFQDLSISNILTLLWKPYENKVVNKGKAELTNATHDLYALLTAIFQEW